MQNDITHFEHYKAQILVNFLRKTTLTKHATKAAQEEKDYFGSWTYCGHHGKDYFGSWFKGTVHCGHRGKAGSEARL